MLKVASSILARCIHGQSRWASPSDPRPACHLKCCRGWESRGREHGSCPRLCAAGRTDFRSGCSKDTRGGTLTRNLLLRREAPYPLGHTSCCALRWSCSDWCPMQKGSDPPAAGLGPPNKKGRQQDWDRETREVRRPHLWGSNPCGRPWGEHGRAAREP